MASNRVYSSHGHSRRTLLCQQATSYYKLAALAIVERPIYGARKLDWELGWALAKEITSSHDGGVAHCPRRKQVTGHVSSNQDGHLFPRSFLDMSSRNLRILSILRLKVVLNGTDHARVQHVGLST